MKLVKVSFEKTIVQRYVGETSIPVHTFNSAEQAIRPSEKYWPMNSDYNFRHLSAFIAVAEELSFIRASERLHIAQPALSRQIRQLEEALNAKLFVRGPAGTELSDAGKAFLPFARRILNMGADGARTASAVHHGRKLPFRFGYSPFSGRGLVRETVHAYREMVPAGAVVQASEGSAALAEMVLTRQLDAALVTLPVKGEDLVSQLVCLERYMVCMRADDPHASEPLLSLESVPENLQVFVSRSMNPQFNDYVLRKLNRAGVNVQPRHFVSSPADVQFLVQSGNGWGLIRESTKLEGDLVRRSIEGVSLKVKTAFICHCHQEKPLMPLLAYRLAATCLSPDALSDLSSQVTA